MTMSAIFLVHTIGFLLILQPTLHLAETNEASSRSTVLTPTGGGETRPHHPHYNNVSNHTILMRRMEMENTRFEFGMTMPMRMTMRPNTMMLGTTLVRPSESSGPSPSMLARVYRHASLGVSPSLNPPSTASAAASTSQQQSHHHRQLFSKILPSPSADGRSEEGDNLTPLEPFYLPSSARNYGPYFESNRTTITIVARAGQMVLLDCAVVLLQGRTVSWLRRKTDSLQLLTVGNATYSSDSRLGLHFRYPNNWRLGIVNVNKKDEGEYKCQLSTHPPKALVYHLKVIAPAVLILDENGNVITERHYKVDSSLHLTCRASHLDKLLDHIGWFKGDRSLPGGDSRIKVKLWKNSTNGEASAFLSVLSVRKGDSGNYTCRASPIASNTIAVHVLNGELPAAVQHENSANALLGSDFLNRWPNTIVILILLISSTFAFRT